MRATGVIPATCLLTVMIAWPATVTAQTRSGSHVPGMRQADVHNPFSPRFAPMVPGSFQQRRAAAGHLPGDAECDHVDLDHGDHRHHLSGGSGINLNVYPNYYPYGYWYPYPIYASYDSYYYRGRYGWPASGYYTSGGYYPGGVTNVYNNTIILPNAPAAPQGNAAGNAAPQNPPRAAARPRAPNATVQARARRLVSVGDDYFADGDYFRALQRYKSASVAMPDQAEPHFRQAQALVAMGKYDDAALQLRLGIALRPDWAETAFRVDDLYAGDAVSLDSHLAELEAATRDDPLGPDAWFVLGVYQYFGGQPDRAEQSFRRAADLTPGDKSHLAGFLAEPAELAQPAAPPPEPVP